MSDARTTHPVQTPEPPYFRGVSFLAGGVGDLLYGSYGRSTNTMVADATSLKKRSGYIRAYEEVFCGGMQAVHHRESGFNYTIAADGTGIKVLTALVPKKGGGNRYNHLSYPNDEFTRADSSTVGNAASGGDHYWREGASGHPSGSGTVYTGFSILNNQLRLANAAGGGLDILIPHPSPLYVWRMELDLSNFDPSGSNTAEYGSYFSFMHGIPMDHIKTDGTVAGYKWSAHDVLAKHESQFRPPSYVSGHTKSAPWMGVQWDLRIFKTGTDYKLEIVQWHYFSSERTNENVDTERDGSRGRAYSAVHTFSNLADLQGKHYLEFGRVQSGPNKILQSFNFWSNRDQYGAPHATPDLAGLKLSATIDAEPKNHAGYHFVSSDPNGRYGHAALFGRVESGTTGTIDIDTMKVAGGFLA